MIVLANEDDAGPQDARQVERGVKVGVTGGPVPQKRERNRGRPRAARRQRHADGVRQLGGDAAGP